MTEERSKSASKMSSAVAGMLDLQGFLPFRIHRIATMIANSGSHLAMKSAKLGLREWRVLAVVGSAGECQQRSVTSFSAMDPATVTRAVRNLLDRGLIGQKVSSEDGRSNVLRLTAEGVALYSELARERLEFQEQLQQSMTDLEWLTLMMMLDKLDEMLGIQAFPQHI